MRLGSPFIIKPTKKQSGGFLGTLLASIDVSLLLKALTGNSIQGYSRYCKCQFLTLVILCNRASPSENLRSRDFTEIHSSRLDETRREAFSSASFILRLYTVEETVTGLSFVKELTRKLKD